MKNCDTMEEICIKAHERFNSLYEKEKNLEFGKGKAESRESFCVVRESATKRIKVKRESEFHSEEQQMQRQKSHQKQENNLHQKEIDQKNKKKKQREEKEGNGEKGEGEDGGKQLERTNKRRKSEENEKQDEQGKVVVENSVKVKKEVKEEPKEEQLFYTTANSNSNLFLPQPINNSNSIVLKQECLENGDSDFTVSINLNEERMENEEINSLLEDSKEVSDV